MSMSKHEREREKTKDLDPLYTKESRPWFNPNQAIVLMQPMKLVP
jgi:hypothetical protein